MQALSVKELEYITDSLSNEELLIKQCAATVAQSSSSDVAGLCDHLITRHTQHYQHLMQVLQQHVQLAPATIQSKPQ